MSGVKRKADKNMSEPDSKKAKCPYREGRTDGPVSIFYKLVM